MAELVKYCGADIFITTAVTFALILLSIVGKMLVNSFEL